MLHTDAAQSAGIRTMVDEPDIDPLTVRGIKSTPRRVGALIRRGVPLEPIMHGAGHGRGCGQGPKTYRIVGLGKPARWPPKGSTSRKSDCWLRDGCWNLCKPSATT